MVTLAGTVTGCFEQIEKVSDKWEQYLQVYQDELAPALLLDRPVKLLEIGVQNGGSLEMWARLLPAGSQVVGLDIDPAVASLSFGPLPVRAHVVDATDGAAIAAALGDETFDVILDDGSHVCRDVRATFGHLWGRLNPGGRYLIEDLHTSYWASHGGGFRAPDSSIEWLKGLVDGLHADHVHADPVATSLGAEEAAGLRAANAWIRRLSFFDSIVVIEKQRAEKVVPYRRIIGGETADVAPASLAPATYPTDMLATLLFGQAAARRMDAALIAKLADQEAEIVALRRRMADMAAEAEHLLASAT